MKKPRVLLADDHKIVLEGLRGLLEPEFELVGCVEDGRALVHAAAELRPDVVVADISMPLLNGIEAVRQIVKTRLPCKVVFLTMHADATYAARAFEAGASAFVLKHSAPAELVTAIKEVLKGNTYVTPSIAPELAANSKLGNHMSRDLDELLTGRQLQVLQLLAEGHSAKQVASILNISARTAEFHKYRLMEELGIHSNAELVQYAIRHGIVSV